MVVVVVRKRADIVLAIAARAHVGEAVPVFRLVFFEHLLGGLQSRIVVGERTANRRLRSGQVEEIVALVACITAGAGRVNASTKAVAGTHRDRHLAIVLVLRTTRPQYLRALDEPVVIPADTAVVPS